MKDWGSGEPWHDDEHKIAQGLRANGYYVINFNTNRQGAPVHKGSDDAIITPDLDVMKGGNRHFAEVKRKSVATWGTNRKIYSHGIGQRLYAHYREMEIISGQAVWMFIHQVDAGQVLYAKLKGWLAVESEFYHGDKMDPGGMVFWNIKLFQSVPLATFLVGDWPDELLLSPYNLSGQKELF